MGTDLRQSAGWARYLSSQGWEVEKIRSKQSEVKVFVRKIPWLGSVIKIQRPAEVPPVEEIDRMAKKHRALFVKLEPLRPLPSIRYPGFEPDPHPNLPTKTIVINLRLTEEELWKNLSQDARQSVRRAQSCKLQVESCRGGDEKFEEKILQFHQLLSETGRRQGFWTSSYRELRDKTAAFGKSAILSLVSPKSGPLTPKPLAGALILLSDGIANYHHAASSPEGQALRAPYLILWEMTRFLKTYDSRSIHLLDLEGIADQRFPQTQKWEGFTVFKRKWGGKEIEFPTPLIKYYSPLTKILFRVAQL